MVVVPAGATAVALGNKGAVPLAKGAPAAGGGVGTPAEGLADNNPELVATGEIAEVLLAAPLTAAGGGGRGAVPFAAAGGRGAVPFAAAGGGGGVAVPFFTAPSAAGGGTTAAGGGVAVPFFAAGGGTAAAGGGGAVPFLAAPSAAAGGGTGALAPGAATTG